MVLESKMKASERSFQLTKGLPFCESEKALSGAENGSQNHFMI